MLEGVAAGQDESAETLAVVDGDELGDEAAGVVADQDGVVEVERLEERPDRCGDPGQGWAGRASAS